MQGHRSGFSHLRSLPTRSLSLRESLRQFKASLALEVDRGTHCWSSSEKRAICSIKLHLGKLLGFNVGISESCAYQVLSVMRGREGHMRMRSSSDRESNLWWSAQATDREAVYSLWSDLEVLIEVLLSFIEVCKTLKPGTRISALPHRCCAPGPCCGRRILAFVQGAFLWQDVLFFPSSADSQGKSLHWLKLLPVPSKHC